MHQGQKGMIGSASIETKILLRQCGFCDIQCNILGQNSFGKQCNCGQMAFQMDFGPIMDSSPKYILNSKDQMTFCPKYRFVSNELHY